MPSSKKTEHMGLNQFIGSDHPKMEDFNFDNTQIDQKFQEHIASQLHLSEQDRQTLLAAKFVVCCGRTAELYGGKRRRDLYLRGDVYPAGQQQGD